MAVLEEAKELLSLLKSGKQKDSALTNRQQEATPMGHNTPFGIEDTTEERVNSGLYQQWTTTDDKIFFPAGKTLVSLDPGFYEPKFSQNQGFYLEKISTKTEDLLRFPETNSQKVIHEIENFWEKEVIFKNYGIPHKRGIILWGPPGSGKSSTIQIIISDIIKRKGIAINFKDPFTFSGAVRLFREIQPNTPMVVLMEDIDSILEDYNESEVLNILDGVEKIDKIVFLATTNYPERLGERIINRPSRFDKRFKMPLPKKKSRHIYIEHLFFKAKLEENNIEKWVNDTKYFSLAHIKELFTAVCILGDSYDESLETIKAMNTTSVSSEEETMENFGFVTKVDEDD